MNGNGNVDFNDLWLCSPLGRLPVRHLARLKYSQRHRWLRDAFQGPMNKFIQLWAVASSIFFDPLAYWRFETANGTTVIDGTGNGFDGNIDGFQRTKQRAGRAGPRDQSNQRTIVELQLAVLDLGRTHQYPRSQSLGFGNQSPAIEHGST